MSKVPPARLLASPIEETVTSILTPGRANGGKRGRLRRPRRWFADLDRRNLILNADAHALEHVAESLHGRKMVLFVWSPVASETDHEAVAYEVDCRETPSNGSQVFEASRGEEQGEQVHRLAAGELGKI